MAQPNYIAETQTLRRIALDPNCRIIWTKHAKIEIAKDCRVAVDVEYSLTNGQVVLIELHKEIKWRVEGRGVDGEKIISIVVVYEDEIMIKFVTVF